MTVRALQLECIGDDVRQAVGSFSRTFEGASRNPIQQPWVAHLTGLTATNFRREFLRGMKDYTHANVTGSRGVTLTFWLQDGDCYEVFRRLSWSRHERYFCQVDSGRIIRITREEAIRWLSAHSALPY